MKKRILFIIGGVLLLCLVVGICLYTIPYKKTNIDAVMQATKLDEDGNILGTDEIVVQGDVEYYLFKNNRLKIDIAPFGMLETIFLGTESNNSSLPLTAFDDFYSFLFTWGWEPVEGGMIYTSQDFEYWCFYIKDTAGQETYYVASASGEQTAEEIVQFFRGLAPRKKYSTETLPINWEMNGTFVYTDGTFAENDISIAGHIRSVQDEADEVDIEISPDAEFPYLFSKPESHYISTNRKYDDMAYLLICYTYTYNRQTNKSTRTVFALDTEKEYFIVLFEDMPNCYYVAATKESITREELLTHFSDFIDACSVDIWE